MKNWTVTDIADCFEEAVYTLRRMPSVKVQGYFSTWPEIIRTTAEQMQQEKEHLRLGPPSAEAISRMEQAIQWVFYLDSEDERRLVWLRAAKVPWKRIYVRLGCGRTKAYHLWVVALMKIVTCLNNEARRKSDVRTS